MIIIDSNFIENVMDVEAGCIDIEQTKILKIINSNFR